MNNKITIASLKEALKNNKDFRETIIKNKYTLEGSDERNLTDILHRIKDVIHSDRVDLDKSIKMDAINLLLSDKFIPGGSILYGLKPLGKRDNNTPIHKSAKNNCSLSNCYVIPLKNDSIEGIGECLTEIMRTYSYRGGCGIDITVLRPSKSIVHNSAKTSSGSVSFMPLFSKATEILGQHGRRGALMITMDVRHPDIMQFIWCKADPKRVFTPDVFNGIGGTEINSANISVRLTDDFMDKVENNLAWVATFPDRESNHKLYDEKWNGDYDEWERIGGKLITKEYYEYIHYKENGEYLLNKYIRWGSNSVFDTQILIKNKGFIKIENIEMLSEIPEGSVIQVLFGSARNILDDIAKACIMRGDPGVQFIDAINTAPATSIKSSETKILSSNPCGEQPIPPYASCLLGSHILHRYVKNPYTEEAEFDFQSFLGNCSNAVLLMNCFSLMNEDLHPLEKQREMESKYRRIGIEFTGLQDTLAMMSKTLTVSKKKFYDPKSPIIRIDTEAGFIKTLFLAKSIVEILTSTSLQLTQDNGATIFSDSNENIESNKIEFANCSYICNLFQDAKLLDNNIFRIVKTIFLKRFNAIASDTSKIIMKENVLHKIVKNIVDKGIFNTSFNTGGPTGTLSVLADNCSSGIEPPFSLLYRRRTRIGDTNTYIVGHNDIFLQKIIDDYTEKGYKEQDEIALRELEAKYGFKVAHNMAWKDRIEIQSIVQRYTDSGISSTINLPKGSEYRDVVKAIILSHKKQLKGITIYVDNTLEGTLSLVNEQKSEEIHTEENYVQPIDLGEVEKAERHRVYWNGVKVYVIVTLINNRPFEVFVKLPREIGEDKGIIDSEKFLTYFSQWEALTRSVSLNLKLKAPLEEVIEQLRKSTMTINDTISILARILSKYLKEDSPQEESRITQNSQTVSTKRRKCPISECKGILVRNQGCYSCTDCDYSTCF